MASAKIIHTISRKGLQVKRERKYEQEAAQMQQRGEGFAHLVEHQSKVNALNSRGGAYGAAHVDKSFCASEPPHCGTPR
eukprot:553846-Pleurochrysis_carterae.AAC.1